MKGFYTFHESLHFRWNSRYEQGGTEGTFFPLCLADRVIKKISPAPPAEPEFVNFNFSTFPTEPEFDINIFPLFRTKAEVYIASVSSSVSVSGSGFSLSSAGVLHLTAQPQLVIGWVVTTSSCQRSRLADVATSI